MRYDLHHPTDIVDHCWLQKGEGHQLAQSSPLPRWLCFEREEREGEGEKEGVC